MNCTKGANVSKANCCVTGSSWSFHFAERSSHWLGYITEGMTEKLYRVLLDIGDMTSLREHWQFNNMCIALGKKCPNKYKKLRQVSTIIGITYFEWEKLVKV